ncbi:MAG: SDR family NAD(P)-dependent oxidoreductase [Bacillota bacterium]
MNIDYKGKLVIVLGATDGIGKGIALSFARQGAILLIVGKDSQKLKQLLNEISRLNSQKHEYLQVDFREHNNAPSIINNYYRDKTGVVDVLVNNSCNNTLTSNIIGADNNKFIKDFANYIIPFNEFVNHSVKLMKKQSSGRIINILATSAHKPYQGLAISNTIHGALSTWGKTLALELAPFNITVNNILVGIIITERQKKIIKELIKNSKYTIDDFLKEKKNEIPLKRFGEVKDVANAVSFLCSEHASYITGTELPINGGVM